MRATNRASRTSRKLFTISSVSGVTLALAVLPGLPASGSQSNVRATTPTSTLITIKFEAKVASVDDSENVFGGTIRAGDTISGFYRYDPSTPDTNDSPNVGDYEHRTKQAGITVNTKKFTFKTDPNNVAFLIEIVNDLSGRDNYLVRSSNNLSFGKGVPVDGITWQLDDPTQTAVSSDALPTTAPTLANYESVFGLLVEGENPATGDPFSFRAHVTKVS